MEGVSKISGYMRKREREFVHIDKDREKKRRMKLNERANCILVYFDTFSSVIFWIFYLCFLFKVSSFGYHISICTVCISSLLFLLICVFFVCLLLYSRRLFLFLFFLNKIFICISLLYFRFHFFFFLN